VAFSLPSEVLQRRAGGVPAPSRHSRLDRGPASFNIRHAFKINSIYALPFGHGREYLTGGPSVARKLIEGWKIAGVGRIQSGTPFQLTSGRSGLNTAETGVVLYNMTAAQLQSMMQIRKPRRHRQGSLSAAGHRRQHQRRVRAQQQDAHVCR
jgi:hypothetical protein